jgi:hypothetical protein
MRIQYSCVSQGRSRGVVELNSLVRYHEGDIGSARLDGRNILVEPFVNAFARAVIRTILAMHTLRYLSETYIQNLLSYQVYTQPELLLTSSSIKRLV